MLNFLLRLYSSISRSLKWIVRSTFTLTPTAERHLRPLTGRNTWAAIGNDPIFHLHVSSRRYPIGWVRVQIETTLLDSTCSIYVDTGHDFNEAERIFLAPPVDGRIDQIIQLPNNVIFLRLDPADEPCEFTLGKISIQEMGGPEAAAHLLAKYLWVERHSFPGVLENCIKEYRRSGWAGLKKWVRDSAIQERRLVKYTRWVAECDSWSQAGLRLLKQKSDALHYKPKFSIVVPVYNTPGEWLRKAIDSVLAQVYPNWELCICDDRSRDAHIRKILESYQQADGRIKLVFRAENGHISQATNDAMSLVTGDYMCLMDHDDEIEPHALFEFAKVLNDDPTVDFIYSDEDKISAKGVRYDPFFKADWSPELIESCMYTAHLACYDMRIVGKIGGFRSECNGAQDYDFVLRYTEHVKNVKHVPKILYHWRAIPGSTALSMDGKDYVICAAVRALEDRLQRTGRTGTVTPNRYKGAFDIRRDVVGNPLVSIVIPSANRNGVVRNLTVDLLANCIESIIGKSSYQNIEIIVVDNGDLQASTLLRLKKFREIKYVTYLRPKINVAAKMNMGAACARGDFLLFLNDDTEVITSDWIESMLSIGQLAGVGAVGAKLLFENETIQHVGVTFCEGLPDQIRVNYPADDPGYFFSTVATKNYLAVTGACILVARDLFLDIGGFDEQFAINYNDIDLCLKLAKSGRRVVYSPLAQLYHFESKSRKREVTKDEIELFETRWKENLKYDPYYGRNLTLKPPTYELHFDFTQRLDEFAQSEFDASLAAK
jgi:GT2 family glycosyltransferase